MPFLTLNNSDLSNLFQAADKFASTSLVMSVLCSTFSIVEFSIFQIHHIIWTLETRGRRTGRWMERHAAPDW